MSSVQLEKEDLKQTVWSTKRIAYVAIFLALSAVGSLIKIPSPVGTIGLDSAPGYFSTLAFGGLEGFLVISIGHMLTSAVVGFPLSIPIHLFIAVQMGLWALAFRWIKSKFSLIPACIAVIILNGIISAFTMMLTGGIGMVIAVMPFLIVGSAINVIIAAAGYKAVKGSKLL